MKAQKLNPSPIENQNEQCELPDLELFKVSRKWTPEQWEQYLVSIETPLTEEQVYADHFDRLAENAEYSIFDLAQITVSPVVVKHVRKLVSKLTKRQREVVEILFFNSKSERDAGYELGLTRNAVVQLKARALKHLLRLLAEGVSTFPLVKGRKKKREASNV